MSYTYDTGTPFGTADVQTPWTHGYVQQDGPYNQDLTQENLMSKQEECELLGDPEGTQLPHDMYSLGMGAGAMKLETLPESLHSGLVTSGSDKSSPANLTMNMNNMDGMHGMHGMGMDIGMDMDMDMALKGEDKNLSEKDLATKRKAQNRAAQRAFRERKEMKLKELEDKLSQSETDKVELQKQLEKLRQQNIVISTENKLLHKSGPSGASLYSDKSSSDMSHNGGSFSFPGEEPLYGRFISSEKQLTNPEIPYDAKKLTIPETYEYLVEKDDPRIDVDIIMKKVKGLEVCHRHGPAYPLKSIDEVVNEFLASRS